MLINEKYSYLRCGSVGTILAQPRERCGNEGGEIKHESVKCQAPCLVEARLSRGPPCDGVGNYVSEAVLVGFNGSEMAVLTQNACSAFRGIG